MTTENKYKHTYIGRLFVNKDQKGQTYLKGKIEFNGETLSVVGFLNEVELKTGSNAGEKAKAFSIALNQKNNGEINETNKETSKKTIKKDKKDTVEIKGNSDLDAF